MASTQPPGEPALAVLPDDVPCDDGRASRWFIHLMLVACILLQRFCIFAGGGAIYICLLVFLPALAWLLLTGRARFRRVTAWLFTAFIAVALVGTLLALNLPDDRIKGMSLPSLASVLLVYGGLMIMPTDRFDGSRTFGLFVLYVRWCAVLGILQYSLQFVGIRIFAFIDVVPRLKPILVEPYFNYHPVIAYGSMIMRSNGFFLVEPSTFSQLLIIGVVIDFFYRRVLLYLPLYALAYLFTYAGTGLLAFAIAAPLAIVLAPSTSVRLVMLTVVAAILAGVAAIAVPSAFGALFGRASELSYSGSSGYARYVAQFDLINAFAGETRTLIGYGPGTLERTNISVAGGVNPVLKLWFEYGLSGLCLFASFLITSIWRRNIALLSLVLLVNYQLGGGYLLFMPFVILSAILCIWSGSPPSHCTSEDVV